MRSGRCPPRGADKLAIRSFLFGNGITFLPFCLFVGPSVDFIRYGSPATDQSLISEFIALQKFHHEISFVMAEYTTKDPVVQAKGEPDMNADELRLAQMGMLL